MIFLKVFMDVENYDVYLFIPALYFSIQIMFRNDDFVSFAARHPHVSGHKSGYPVYRGKDTINLENTCNYKLLGVF